MVLIRCVDDLPLYGGAPCLDLANTVEWRARDDALDVLYGPADLAHWTRHVGLAGAAGERRQQAAAPGPGAGELAAGRQLRGAGHDPSAAIAAARPPSPAALETIRRDHAEAVAAGTLRRGGDGAYAL